MSDSLDRVAAAFEAAGTVDDPALFLALADRDSALASLDEDLPLAGITFVAKDNIDVAGLPTTAAFLPGAYRPAESAPCVERLVAAGATCVGKVNMDQFATGLVGTRSPHGPPRNPIDPGLVPGGSSSGSAVAVARGIVDLGLGTDTAGSGRVPAAQCRIVGIKPTRGRVSTRGVVPAVRSLDCVSVFARTVADADRAVAVVGGFDPDDPWSRPAPATGAGTVRRLGVPRSVDLDGPLDDAAWAATVASLDRLGVELVEIDLDPLVAAGALLYGGPWVAARVEAFGALAASAPDAVDPSVAAILAGARTLRAEAVFAAEHQLAELRRASEQAWAGVDALIARTTPGPATLDEVAADPLGRNARLGLYTNGANLLDLCGVAIPGADRADGWPTGVTVLAPAWADDAVIGLAARWLDEAEPVSAVTSDGFDLVVVGAHLSGLPLNHQLTDLGAVLVAVTTTAPAYELHALAGTVPPKPGLVHVGAGGAAIAAEVWRLPPAAVGTFLAGVPAPLAIGTVELADGTSPHGFVCEPRALAGATDVTGFGSWRAYSASLT